MPHVFISHASADDDFVAELRRKLELHGVSVWVDSRNLRGGDGLDAAIGDAIASAQHCLVVISPETVNSPWVKKEIDLALGVQAMLDDYRVIPLLLPGIRPAALGMWFAAEPLGVKVELDPGSLDEALPRILAALGRELPADATPPAPVDDGPVDELILALTDPRIVELDGAQRAAATATLTFEPADGDSSRAVTSGRYTVTAPLGPVELEEIRWYLEEFPIWPVGIFKDRAARTEEALPGWGRALHAAALGSESARTALAAWRNGGGEARRLSILMDQEPPEGATDDEIAQAHAGATELLALPWEILSDEGGYLLHGAVPTAVRRSLPNRNPQAITPAQPPIRILILSPRPELMPDGKAEVGYIDHRASALPLVQAVENLGELARLTVLHPPTLPALQTELRRAREAGAPYHVVHFDGHGIYDRRAGLGALLFENPADQTVLGPRTGQLVHADRLAAIMRQHAIPLVMLEACQSGQSEEDLNSVATRLLQEGVSSVAAMSYTVLVETARRFVEAFYRELAQGRTVGRAVLAGQTALEGDSFRIRVMGAGALRMQDWFVPVLYQDRADPRLFARLPGAAAQRMIADQAVLRLGELPATPAHTFVGRSRELLGLERLLMQEKYAVVRGSGGAGKTTLAVEAARWLVRSHRFTRAAFVSLEEWQDDRAVLDVLARQLLPGDDYSVALFPSLDAALQPVARALRDHPTIIVIDNVESVLEAGTFFTAESAGGAESDAEKSKEKTSALPSALSVSSAVKIFDLCQRLLNAHPATRLIFTSREGLPGPFDRGRHRVELGALGLRDAIELVKNVLTNEGRTPRTDDAGNDPQQIRDLVNAVNRHARALVLLARFLPEDGVSATTGDLHRLMAELEKKHPGQRENSLFASVKLSARRLPPTVQEKIKGLAVFHGGGHVANLGAVMEAEPDEARSIAVAMIEVGMADDMGYGYLRLDPALAPYLARDLDAAALERLRARWAEAMMQLVSFLYQQQFQDAQLAAQLTLLELPNLLALVAHLSGGLDNGDVTPEQAVDVAGSIEQLLALLGRPAALARAVALRQAAAAKLGDWSRPLFQSEASTVERLLGQGKGGAALQAAQALHQRASAAGEDVYANADYDIAVANFLLGRVLRMTGQAGSALTPLAAAQTRFQALADGGNRSAARQAATALTEQGGCLTALGRLDEAAAKYEQSIGRLEKLDDPRSVAVTKGELGTVRIYQQRYAEALELWNEYRRIFEQLGEPREVATAWHQMGVVHRESRHWEAAERAYRQGLSLRVQHKLTGDQAASLGELGNLYDATGRLEEAVVAYRQAADIDVALGDLKHEGLDRNNIANALVKLGRLDEARREVQRAIECAQPFGHAALPWTSFAILHDIERASGREDPARVAWVKARDAYLSYRRDGGGDYEPGPQLVAAVEDAIRKGQTQELRTTLVMIRQSGEVPEDTHVLIDKLIGVLDGERDPDLTNNVSIPYNAAAELLLLLERLGGG